MNEKFRVAIVGCGGISHVHANAVKESDQIELIAACDVNVDGLKNFVDEFQIKHAYLDLRKMIESQKPEILIIATWPIVHLNNVLEAIRGNIKGILCEKPIAINAEQTRQISQVTTKRGVILTEGFMYRHHPLTIAVKKMIKNGEIGEVRFVRSTFTTGLTDTTNWRMRGDRGGGAVMDLGCYCVNAIRHFIDREPKKIWATGKFAHGRNAWDTLIGTLDFGDGVVGQFDCSFGWIWRESCEIVGTNGSISIPKALLSGKGICEFFVNGERIEVDGVNPYAAEMINLCEAIRSGEPLRVPIDDSIKNMIVIDALHESAKSGSVIEI